MGRKSVTGTTKSAKTAVEKKVKKEKKAKPSRLTNEEKERKYGVIGKALNYKINFTPKTETQKEYFDTINNCRITFGTGVAGSGKSFVCLSAALKLLQEDNQYKQILIITPTAEAGNMQLGFLPGTKEEKIQEYLEADMQTIKDIFELGGNEPDECLKSLLENNLLHGDCVNFMRGKTIKNKIVIITEAENFNKQELFLLLSRIAPSSKYIINGDNRQQDRKDIKNDNQNGLKYAMNTLKGKLPEVGFCHFHKEDCVRDPLIIQIMDLWFNDDEKDDEY